jgi:DNA-binding beta-propeller fold protein YncE
MLASTGAIVGVYASGAVNAPYGVTYDGANIWVTNGNVQYVTKILASTGAVVGTYLSGVYSNFMAFDGTNLWATIVSPQSVMELNPSTGAVIATYAATNPYGIAFDGTNMWVGNRNGSTVSRF